MITSSSFPSDPVPLSECPMGRFAPSGDLTRWWGENDLAPLVPWSEKDCRGWVLPGYEWLSPERVPWERARRQKIEGWRQVKKSGTRRVVRQQGSAPTEEVLYYKWVQIVGPRKTLGSAFRASKATREFRLARQLLSSGYLTPTPLLVAERRCGPFLRDAWLVTRGIDPEWDSVRSIWSRLRAGGEKSDPARADHLVEELGQTVRHFHDRGLFFADSRAHHWFTRHESAGAESGPFDVSTALRRWALIDLDASRLGRRPSDRWRRRLLAMLAASFPTDCWTPEDSTRLFESYGGDRRAAPSAFDAYMRLVIRIRNKGGRPSQAPRRPPTTAF